MKTTLRWKLGYCNSATARPSETFPAKVPGSVQLDYAAAYDLPDYRFETNFEQYRWMEDKFWVYSAEYDATELTAPHLRFVTKGIDYEYDIYVNGEKQLSYEGMYHTTVFDLTGWIGQKIILEIVVYPVPKSTLSNVHAGTRDEQNQSCKPGVSYGWDFHPRLVPLGIWNETYLEISDQAEPIKPIVTYKLNEDRSLATVTLQANADHITEWTVTAPNGEVVFHGNQPFEAFEIENPLLWWCNGYGEPNLYTWELRVNHFGLQETYSGRIGFKTVTLEMNAGTWDLPDFPKSRSCAPITLCLNGVPIFAKGANWVCPEIFYSELSRNRYQEQLELVRSAHMNIVRCWGGAVVNKTEFFDLCDELGIMVWQEFPLGCNNYIATDRYMELLRREATDIIEHVSTHACHVIWCGGNELFNSWSGMTDQSLPLRLLNSLTLEHTPNIPFLATSPLMGMGHGSYIFIYHNGREVIDVMQHSNNTAYTEFGCPAISNLECLKQITSVEDLFPLVENQITTAHHAFHAWGFHSHACLNDIAHYYKESNSLEELISHSQFLQSVAYRFIFEEARRQKPHCSMAINWCLNEPWPCVANNSVICYPNHIKQAYFEIAKACRPVAATARYRKLKYKSGEVLDFDLFLLNDGQNNLDPMTVSVSVQVGEETPAHLMHWEVPTLAANTNFAGPTLRYTLPVIPGAETLRIILESEVGASEYTLLYDCPIKEAPKAKVLNM